MTRKIKTTQAGPRRRYDSSRRKEQQRQTRLEIAKAARDVFLERGYAGATLEAIAAQAGVAVETLYAAFENKRSLLAFVLDISLAGDDQPIPIIERARPQAVLRDTDQRRQLEAFAADITEILARGAAVFEVTRIAGKTEPEIGERVEHLLEERLRNMRLMAERVAANGPLHPGIDVSRAAQTIWIVTSPDVYMLTTAYLGWAKEEYRRWLIETLKRLLLP
ncbi:MAG TPA: helix-turn-helix domain-containing protein [Anaerolineales bacterium]